MSLNQLRRVTNVPFCVILIKPNKGALSSRKYSIFIYMLMEICFQWSKLLDPLCKIKNWDHSWTNWENPFQKGQTQKFLIKGTPSFGGLGWGIKFTYLHMCKKFCTKMNFPCQNYSALFNIVSTVCESEEEIETLNNEHSSASNLTSWTSNFFEFKFVWPKTELRTCPARIGSKTGPNL